MFRGIETVRRLWRGEVVTVPGGAGNEIAVEIFPKPVQASLPVWLATGGNPQTFVEAGEIDANVLTALLFLSVDELAARIALYRKTLAKHGHDPRRREVTLMLHTFLGEDLDTVRETVRQPFYDYLRSHFELIKPMAEEEGIRLDRGNLSAADEQALLGFAFERYFDGSSLCGTEERCRPLIARLTAIGVDEVACLIDFGIGIEQALASLERLVRLGDRLAAPETAGARAFGRSLPATDPPDRPAPHRRPIRRNRDRGNLTGILSEPGPRKRRRSRTLYEGPVREMILG